MRVIFRTPKDENMRISGAKTKKKKNSNFTLDVVRMQILYPIEVSIVKMLIGDGTSTIPCRFE